MHLNQRKSDEINYNKKLILDCVRQFAPISRAEVYKKLEISKPTVSSIAEELIEEGWIYESDIGRKHRKSGRKPTYLQFNEKAFYVLGVDIGGTKVLVALSDLEGNIIYQERFDTAAYLHNGFLNKLQILVSDMLSKCKLASNRILGMGIGVPGITDNDSGVVIDAPSLGWKNFPLKQKAMELFDFPVVIDNDVNVSALGEQWLGAAKHQDNIILIAIGTGVGSGIVINGKLYRGASWGAGEIGYMVTDTKQSRKQNRKPPYKGYGYLESQIGGAAIKQRVSQELLKMKTHPLNSEKENLSVAQIFALAMKGDELCEKVVLEAIEHLSLAIVNAIILLNPDVVILGGGISKSGDWFLPIIQRTVKQFVPFGADIRLTELSERSGVIGAISLLLREKESVLKL